MTERGLNPFTTIGNPRYNGRMGEGFPSLTNEADTILAGIEAARKNIDGTAELRQRIEGREAREAHLRACRIEGFETQEQEEVAIRRMAAVGIPVDGVRILARKENETGRENVLASWEQRNGRVTEYHRLDKEHEEAKHGTYIHELVHQANPLRTENAFKFGSEEARAEAEQFVRAVAEQTILTDKPLNGYHAWLLDRYRARIITKELFIEESGTIVSEMAMTRRQELEDKQKAQHSAMMRLGRRNEVINLISQEKWDGSVKVDGADKMLINLISESKGTYNGLMDHIGSLKEEFYPENSLQIAQQRGTARTSQGKLAMAA
jgi:hypothetical protein